ncbi:DUF5133 domain-containing protein [Streptomyces brasiliensis]|uniref:DUF5133 domain-containing protein n=1 Tax=Streptomyces brasiliensis TaxID=1954 RepID=UPI0027E4AAB0|nr:DUF5133 domain-containing protein [Streptomyces brasiliensis]
MAMASTAPAGRTGGADDGHSGGHRACLADRGPLRVRGGRADGAPGGTADHGLRMRQAPTAATVWVTGGHTGWTGRKAVVITAHPALLRELVERCESLRRRLAADNSAETARRSRDAAYRLCVITGTRHLDTALFTCPDPRPTGDAHDHELRCDRRRPEGDRRRSAVCHAGR